MFHKLNYDKRLLIIQAATEYIAQTSEIYDPDDLKEKLPAVCDVLTSYLLSEKEE